jgi:hypothetical protein
VSGGLLLNAAWAGARFYVLMPARAASFDHLVGAGGQHGRHIKVECLRGLEVDNELEFSTLFDLQIGYLRFLLLPPIYFATLPGSTTIVAVMRGCSEQKYS